MTDATIAPRSGLPGTPPSDRNGANDREVAGASGRVTVFRRGSLLGLVVSVPILTTVALVYYRLFPEDPMLASGLAAVVVGFVVFLIFARQIPDAFAMIRLRGLIPPESIAAYAGYESTVTSMLNSRWSVALAAAGAVIGFARYPVAWGGFDAVLGQGIGGVQVSPLVAVADILGETIIGAAAGLAIWRMIVVGAAVYRLGRFPLRVQLGHPDRCGGFQPIGNLCLWNALILSVPGVFLGFWIAAGPSSQYGSTYVALHSVLASIVVVLATVAFLAPLWGIHRAMVRSAAALRVDVERHGQRIDELARELIAARDDLTPEDLQAKSADLDRRKALYVANEHIPTWPIDVRLATKFGTSQLVPLLGLTGLSKPILDVIGGVTSLLDGGSG